MVKIWNQFRLTLFRTLFSSILFSLFNQLRAANKMRLEVPLKYYIGALLIVFLAISLFVFNFFYGDHERSLYFCKYIPYVLFGYAGIIWLAQLAAKKYHFKIDKIIAITSLILAFLIIAI